MSDASSLDAPKQYESLYVTSIFSKWPKHLLRGLQAHHTVLDVACGTGVVARHAADQLDSSGLVTGADVSPDMLAVARQIAPDITWLQCPAEALNCESQMFDRVVCQFGLMFFQDRATAFAEMHRVLKPGGHLSVTVWQPLERNPVFLHLAQVLTTQVGAHAAEPLQLPYCLGDVAAVQALFAEAGFDNLDTGSAQEQACFPDVRTLVEAEIRGWLPLFDVNLDDAQAQAVVAQCEADLAHYCTSDGEFCFPTAAWVVSGQKA